MKRKCVYILQTLKTVLWSFLGIGGGRKRGEDYPSNPLMLMAIGFVLTLLFVGTLIVIAKAMVEVK